MCVCHAEWRKKKDEETEVRGEVRQKKSRHGGAGDGGGGGQPGARLGAEEQICVCPSPVFFALFPAEGMKQIITNSEKTASLCGALKGETLQR